MTEEPTAQSLTVEPLAGYEPTIGRWLWLLEDTRRETLEALAGITPAALDWLPPQGENSIGTLLYHIALIEMDWLYVETLESRPWPEALQALFDLDARDASQRLSVARGESMESHLRRLGLVRRSLLDALLPMSLEEFRRPRQFPTYHVTPEWVIQHLVQHEGEHRGQIQMLRSLAQVALTPR